MPDLLEGEVRHTRRDDGGWDLTAIPKVARLRLVRLADPAVVAEGNRVTFAGRAVYRVRGWDHAAHVLICDLVEDRGVVPWPAG